MGCQKIVLGVGERSVSFAVRSYGGMSLYYNVRLQLILFVLWATMASTTQQYFASPAFPFLSFISVTFMSTPICRQVVHPCKSHMPRTLLTEQFRWSGRQKTCFDAFAGRKCSQNLVRRILGLFFVSRPFLLGLASECSWSEDENIVIATQQKHIRFLSDSLLRIPRFIAEFSWSNWESWHTWTLGYQKTSRVRQ